ACFCTFQQMTKKDLLNCPQAVFNFVQAKLKGLSYEVFMVIFLNAKNESIGYEILHQGTIDRTAVYPRRVVESALSNHATGIILVHNHPSGHPEPSDEDRKITCSILKATSTVDIKVLDHIIVGKSGYFSFAEKGIL
ncbi:DNA repair protein RadC, partial [Candidatus Aerophobetes bacterium]|nr:DNA repair protein RadC [Candidatus Aerophobetes bacterium]